MDAGAFLTEAPDATVRVTPVALASSPMATIASLRSSLTSFGRVADAVNACCPRTAMSLVVPALAAARAASSVT